MNWEMLPPLLLAVGAVLGVPRLIELLIPSIRRKVRGEGKKIEVEAEATISDKAIGWAGEFRADAAAARTEAAAARADAAAAQAATDQVIAKLRHVVDELDRLEGRIARCQAGPVCPVRTADTDPRIPRITS